MKNHLGEKEYQSYAAWKRAIKKACPDAKFYGDKDIGGAYGVGEWDGEKGSVFQQEQIDAFRIKKNPAKKSAKRKTVFAVGAANKPKTKKQVLGKNKYQVYIQGVDKAWIFYGSYPSLEKATEIADKLAPNLLCSCKVEKVK